MRQGQDDTMQGVGCPGGCQGPGSARYQWVQGVDGLGNTVGYWRPTRPMAPNAPYARNSAPFFGEVAEAADGHLYQWVQGVDGLGSPFGFWKRLKRLAQRAMPLVNRLATFVPGASAALTVATPFLKQAGIAGLGEVGALYAAPDGSLYQLQGVDGADSIDGLADDDLRGVADDELRGLSDDELRGIEADDELSGYASGDDLNGFAADDLDGVGADPDLQGYAATDPLDGVDADELNGLVAGDDVNGFADDALRGTGGDEPTLSGYVRDGGVNGIDGYGPESPARTPDFSPAPNAPMWAPLW